MNKPWTRSRRFWVGIGIGYVLCGLTALGIVAAAMPEKIVGSLVKPTWEPTPIMAVLQCSEPALPTELMTYAEGFKDGVPFYDGPSPQGFVPIPFDGKGGVFFIPPCPDLDNQVPEPSTLALLAAGFGAMWRMR